MELQEAILLIQTDEFIQGAQSTWADLGCGSGLFTQALASMLYAESTVYAIDKNISSFKLKSVPNKVVVKAVEADFVNDNLNLKSLDGILMANALHFVRDKKSLIEKVSPYFRERPFFLIVEYDTDKPNPWVPYPVSLLSIKKLFTGLGYGSIKKLHETKSLYHTGNLYSALITR
jgi:ubiquinone/menaquinone biosynthesis C-methylase UbiE